MIAYIRRLENDQTDQKFVAFDDVLPVLYDYVTWHDGHPACGGISMKDMGVFYFRAVGSATHEAQRLVNYAIAHDIRVADAYLLDGARRRHKDTMAETLLANDVAHPKTYSVDDLRYVADTIESEDIDYPCVLKFSKGGRRGIGTFYLTTRDTVDDVYIELRRRRDAEEKGFVNMGEWPFVIQEYIPNGGDYRAITVGGECIGIVKRGEKSTNLLVFKSSDHGARKYKRNRWPRTVGDLAVRAANVMKVDVSGVDIVRHSDTGMLYVIEVNEAPAFNVFQRRTGIDVAERIVSWLRTLV